MNQQDTTSNTINPITPIKLGKFKASRMIVNESWNILKQDREIAWFPVLSAIVSLFALVILSTVLFFVIMKGDVHAINNIDQNQTMSQLGYVMLFVYYLIMFFITNYFLASIYTIVHGRFMGLNLSFADGIKNANKNIGKIFIWSLISATVGIILQIISDKSKIVGKIVISLLGSAWNILTYFSLPSLIIGKKSVKESFKESAALIRKTWGETIIVNFGMGLFFGLILFLGTALSVGILVLIPIFEIFISVGILYIIFIISLVIISSTLNSIFKLALYEFAVTGNIPKGFTPELITGAVTSH